MKDTVLSLLRHLLTFGGAYFASKGVIAVDAVQFLTSGLVALVAAIWGAFDEWHATGHLGDAFDSAIRHLLTAAGGVLQALGILPADTVAQLVPALIAAVGALQGAIDEYRFARAAKKGPLSAD